MDRILEAGRIAPTAANTQPQRIIAINTPEGMRKLAQCTPFTYGAPETLVVCYDETEVWVRNYDGKNSGDVDASIVTTQMMLQAADLGIGTCWVGHFDPRRIRELFHIPEHIVPVAILDMGYPGEKGQPHPVHWKRKDLDETFPAMSYNDYSNVFKGRVDVDIFLAMNAPMQYYKQAYEVRMQEYFAPLRFLNGQVRIFPVCDTLQVKDYSKYDMAGFSEEHKKAVHDAEFPKMLEQAFQIGENTI